MLKLIRSSVFSAVAAWAWQNRATIIEKVKSLTDSGPADTATGYAEVVGKDGMISKPAFDKAATA
ncbi:MAG: hypothetical protein R2733_17015 [Acidimicrobiales bacterium]